MKALFRHTALVLASTSALAGSLAHASEINLYTTREQGLIQPLLEAYTAKTGVKVNTVFLKDGLPERVASEGAKSPADVLMAVDVNALVDLTEKGVTQPIKSAVLDSAIPANLRDAQGNWFALSMRARTLYTVKTGGPTAFTYEDLADPKYKGKVCIRSGQHPYNTALIAHIIAKDGEAKAEQWLRGVKANLARKAGGGDREVARDIMGGVCDLGLANSYYVGLMRSGKGGADQQKWGDAINVVLPTFTKGGTHVNVSGAAIAKHAPNKDNAVKLLEFLVSDEAQAIYAKANYEYPVKKGAAIDPIIAALGPLNVDSIPLTEVAKHRKAASVLVDKVGFDN
ncbi:extracellular solute-binding protein [Uliginosibacterium sp. H3]|uniref:Extracellular solute-binding protein n=1 Tax=Uliginosibacterium silvisoli TaxID=3114758 RepID=A0ABU6K5A0_9RHOO|nr:extracellular solute-binding protein [Uliginosibacterium sp. H3]